MDFQFLVEMAWKSALICAAALALAALLRTRSASERSALLGTAAAMIVALPVISLLLPSLIVVTGTAHEAAAPSLAAADLAGWATKAPPPPSASVLDDPAPLIELLWAGGVLMVLIRLGAGLWTLRRWTRSGSEVECPDWPAALERAKAGTACRRDVRLLVSDVPAPLSWGWLNPVILLDRDTVRDPADADAVIAHEAAHVVRGDWLVLMLARLAVALFWFNPLMWLLERRIVGEAEEAADARAIEHVEPARYAQVLLSCAQHQAMPRLPASGMADAGLGRRVKAILERRLSAGTADPRWIRAAMILAALVAAPIAALKPVVAVVRADAPTAAPPAPPAPAAAPSAPAAPAAPPAPEALAVLAVHGIAPPPPGAPAAPPAIPVPPPVPYRAMAAPLAPLAPPAPPARLRPLVDADEIARDVQEAIAEAMQDKDEALREAAEAREEALREDRGARAEEIRRVALEAARRGMAEGARGMEEGARGMEEGADRLEREAAKLGSRDYREQQIARAARDGKALTHQQLLDMIPRFRESAEGMRRGAAGMRRNAEKMRRQG
jgi:beta-lactamase regulating signal transducer with metallopeptidase domain